MTEVAEPSAATVPDDDDDDDDDDDEPEEVAPKVSKVSVSSTNDSAAKGGKKRNPAKTRAPREVPADGANFGEEVPQTPNRFAPANTNSNRQGVKALMGQSLPPLAKVLTPSGARALNRAGQEDPEVDIDDDDDDDGYLQLSQRA